MRTYIQALQSQIARNSAEITLRERMIRFSYEELKADNREDCWLPCIIADKKHLVTLVKNQKALKKLLGELILFENY